jgi:hypothetical protein
MPRFKVAHLHEQGQDMVVVPLDGAFGSKSESDQRAALDELQAHSDGAGLKGTVVAVWESGGRMRFIAPPAWHPFVASLSMRQVAANINREIYW